MLIQYYKDSIEMVKNDIKLLEEKKQEYTETLEYLYVDLDKVIKERG